MSSMNIDQPLEEVIKAKRQERRSQRKPTARKPAGGARQGGAKRLAQGAKPVASRVIPKTKEGQAVNEEAKKIIISNLPADVNDHALKEFMLETVGPVAECSISYDQRGVSKGFGQVRFKRKGDGNKAYKEFNGRVIDNNRPIKIEIVVETSEKSGLSQRLAPKPAETVTTTKPKTKKAIKKPLKKRDDRSKQEKRPVKSAEDLDAEMEDYTQNKAE